VQKSVKHISCVGVQKSAQRIFAFLLAKKYVKIRSLHCVALTDFYTPQNHSVLTKYSLIFVSECRIFKIIKAKISNHEIN
jgi:hypothetical protein